MVCATETYGFKSPNIEGWGAQTANHLTHNGLGSLPKYGRICEKTFSSRDFLILRGG